MLIYKASGSFFRSKIKFWEGPEKGIFGGLGNAQMPIFITFQRFIKIERRSKKRPEKGPKRDPLGPPKNTPSSSDGGGAFYIRVCILSTFSPSRNRFSEIRAGRKTAKTCFPKEAILGAPRTLQMGLAQTTRITVLFAFVELKRAPEEGPKSENSNGRGALGAS